ncbi:carcinoembryonic antigen-related cell adhesion molecule 5 isoform X1 [Takifugu flavidus]|uniref:carcinoembryonic antigen-related cell adhesion molecule 5 isoform X1 n=1 Tax=Takifugu flavidus TaxID=433684 RepID=UPI00254405F5|nr:carcinoembryonic antigen-related cell adhesion molecule 5 isoform X1 [Takifugu flavidus]
MWLREVFGVFYLTAVFATTDAQNDLPKPVLKVTQGWADAFENEIMEFLCEVDTEIPDVTFTWYKDKKELQEDTDIYSEESYLNITSVERVHEGGYTCQIQLETTKSEFSNTISVTVYENVPKATLKKDSDLNPMYVGETVNFTCNVGVATGWQYQWHKDGMALNETDKTYSMDLQPSAAGRYSCLASRGSMTSTEMSGEIKQDVANIPVPSLRNLVPWQDVFPGERVQMSCHMNDSADWTYTWYKDGQEVHTGLGVSFDSNKATLFISSAAATSRGEYKCTGHLINRSVSTGSSSGFNLEVYDEMPKVTLTQDPDYKVIFPGESVVFSCHINNSDGWEYIWLKDMNSLPHTDKRLSISPRDSSDQGSYECQAKRGTDHPFYTDKSRTVNIKVEENKPQPLMTQQPDVEKVYIGEPVSFKCEIKDSAGWEYVWFKDGKELPLNTNVLDIPHASVSDSGTYECKGIRNKTKYNSKNSHRRQVLISEIPSPKVENITQWLHVFPTESLRLSCEMDGSSDWMFSWHKDGQEVHAGQDVSFDKDATVLSINSASASHRGRYSCSGKHKQRTVSSNVSSGIQLDVYDTKPRVQLSQSPEHTLMHTEDSVTFLCHINISTGWEFLWFKDDRPLTVPGNNLTLSSMSVKNTGLYKCQTRRGTSLIFSSDPSPTIYLTVEERPKAEVILLTGWSQVFSTDSLLLSCRLQNSQERWNYTWYRDGRKLENPPSPTYRVTPQDDPEQSQYSCQGIRNGTLSYSRISDQFWTKNLLLKRRLLLSIAGCIVFGICIICIGCIVLRMCRKKAQEDYKPEEADLFLRMDALKDSDDGPPLLVQYVTESALNSLSKEEGENGTVISESPLPPVQEEPATTTESSEAMQNNNSGLISFMQ